jgi:predicted phage terminase large subunit-like protein
MVARRTEEKHGQMTTSSPASTMHDQIAAMLLRIDAEECRRSFRHFVQAAWSEIEPGRTYVGGWHLDAIADHLQAVEEGKIKRLLVNMPPRHGKSSLISVLWSVWLLIRNPARRILCASYAMNLAIRDNVKSRRLIKSQWFQERFGCDLQLMPDQDAKQKFETDKLGYRMAVSVGSSATGEGGDILILDDCHNIDEKESDAKRSAALDWFDNTFNTRLNDQQTGAIVVVGQRIHEDDVSGHILENNFGGEWIHLNLSAEYHADSPCRTFLPDGSLFWQDERKEDGELLWEARFPQAIIEKAKHVHGALEYSALYDQNPIPPGGYVFKASNERLFSLSHENDMYLLETPGGVVAVPIAACYELTTSDVAAKEKEQNDFTVFAQWAVTPANDVLLLDVWRGHWTIPQQKEKARAFYRRHYSQRYRAFYFEDVGYQSAIGQDLLVEGIPCLPFKPDGDKVLRATGGSIWQEAGKVYFYKHASWLEDFRTEIYKFPKTRNDDQTDTLSMVCMLVRTPEIRRLASATASALSNFRGY